MSSPQTHALLGQTPGRRRMPRQLKCAANSAAILPRVAMSAVCRAKQRAGRDMRRAANGRSEGADWRAHPARTETPERRTRGAAGARLFPAVVAAAPAVGYRQHEGRDHEHQVDADQPGQPIVRNLSMFMKAFSTWIAEIATIEANNFCLSPAKLTLVIHSGQSGWPSGSILETKFS